MCLILKIPWFPKTYSILNKVGPPPLFLPFAINLTLGKSPFNTFISCIPYPHMRMEPKNLSCHVHFFYLDCDQRHVDHGDRCRLLLSSGERLSAPEQCCSRGQGAPVPCANDHEASPSTSLLPRDPSGEEEHRARCEGA